MADQIRRQRRLRATTVVDDDACDECGHPDARHYVDGSCEICSRCDARDDDDPPRRMSGAELEVWIGEQA